MVDVLLQSGDALRAQLARHQGAGGEPVDTADVQASIRAMSSGQAPAATAPIEKAIVRDAAEQMAGEALAPKSTTTATATAPARELDVRVGPLKDPAQANDLVALFNEITDLGTIEAIDCGQPSDGIRRFRVVTTSADADLLDLFTFHVARDEVMMLPVTAGCGFHAGAPGAPAEVPLADHDPGYGFFDNAPGAPGSVATTPNVDTPAASADAANASVNTARAPPPLKTRPPPRSNRRRCASRSKKSISSSTWSASSSSRRRCWRKTASRSTPRFTSSPSPAWPISTATPATCKSR